MRLGWVDLSFGAENLSDENGADIFIGASCMRTRFTDLRYGVIGVAKKIRRQWTRRHSRVSSGSPSTCHRFFYPSQRAGA